MAVPTAVAGFPHELPMPPREYAPRFYNIQRWTNHERGGHFAAHEAPELLEADMDGFSVLSGDGLTMGQVDPIVRGLVPHRRARH